MRRPTIKFKSGFESQVFQTLRARETRKKDSIKVKYESQKLSYTLSKRYIPDFTVTLPDGREFFIEAKGYFRPEDRTKLLAVVTDNPGIDVRLLFLRDNKLRKNAKTTYSQWATKHGFTYAVGRIPNEWFN